MDPNTSPSCPGTITVRRNPLRRARATPKMMPKSFDLPEISAFPNDDVLPAQTLQNPSTSPENENLKVFLRIRPLPSSPIQAPRVRGKSAWPRNPAKKNVPAAGAKISKSKNSSACITVNDSQSVTLSTPVSWQESKRIKSETYGGFSHVFSSDSSQFQVYERMVKPLVEEFLGGKSGMLAALGPSGSGKTHTVFGTPRDPGMVPLALRHIFEHAEPHLKQASRTFYMSIFEICSERGKAEKLFDLLSDGGEISMQQSSVKGLKEVTISNTEQAESLIAQAALKRATAMTNTNSQSSRSQCIINIRGAPPKCKGVVNPKSNSAVLTIIDLAGAEREKRTGNQGARLLESNFINNTLMVFGLCLRSLLEHQKNPKKPLQKHFQSSMLTRYLRDYLEGKKRMSLILTAKPGEENYLDTSYLLRQASPYMQIKYNEVEPSNMVPKKRHYQASSIMEDAKLSPLSENLKRMRLATEHTEQNDKKGLEERKNIAEDTSALGKLDANSSVSFKSEFDRQVRSERSHIIMQNFAKVIWNVLKQYNSKLKVAEMEIESHKVSIGIEKTKYLEIETQLNEFKAFCTCCKVGRIKNDPEDCLSVSLAQPHNAEQQETFHAESSFLARVDQSDEEGLVLSTSCTLLESENSDREALALSKPEHHGALEADDRSKLLGESTDAQSSSEARLDQSDQQPTLGTSCTQLDAKVSDRKISTSLLKAEDHNALEVEAVSKISSESFDAQSSSEARLDQSDEQPTLGTSCTQLDAKVSDRKISTSLLKAEDRNALEVEAVSKISSESFDAQSSSEARLDQSDQQPTLGTSCTQLDAKVSDRKILISLLKAEDHNALEVEAVSKISSESFDAQASSEARLDQSDEQPTLGTSSTQLDAKVSDRKISTLLLKAEDRNALEVEAVSKISSESFDAQSLSEARLDQSDQQPTLGTSCTQLDAKVSDRKISTSLLKAEDRNALEVEAVSKISSESFDAQSLSEVRLDQSDEELTLGTSCGQLDSEKSDREISISLSKAEDHNALEVEAVRKIRSELLVSSSSTEDDNLDPSSPKDASSTKIDNLVGDPRGKIGVDISRKPPKPKRTLMPSSSMLSRDLSTFDLCDKSEKLKGNRGTRKLAAHEPQRSNGSISLLHLLQVRKSNLHR